VNARLRRAVPNAVFDAAFAALRHSPRLLGYRAALRMCWSEEEPPVPQTLPEGYALQSIIGPSPFVGWIETLGSAGIRVTAATWSLSGFDGEAACALGLIHDGTLIGTAGVSRFSRHDARTGLLNWVGIRPDYQGRGLARPLVASCIRTAYQSGVRTLLLVTDDERIAGIRTYQAVGFRPCIYTWDWTHGPRWRRIQRSIAAPLSFCEEQTHDAVMRQADPASDPAAREFAHKTPRS
jgi:GNAT superfamily N-acetyltransferase